MNHYKDEKIIVLLATKYSKSSWNLKFWPVHREAHAIS